MNLRNNSGNNEMGSDEDAHERTYANIKTYDNTSNIKIKI